MRVLAFTLAWSTALLAAGCSSDDVTPSDASVEDAADASTTDDAGDALEAGDASVDAALVDAASDEARAPIHLRATGFFHTEQQGGRWWLVTPEGKPFYSLGVSHVTWSNDTDRTTGRCPYCEAVTAKYPDQGAWATATVERLESWGFNTVGAWSDSATLGASMPYTDLLDIGSGAADYFSPEFAAHCAEVAASTVAARKDDPLLVGWFLDNEMHWGPDWRNPESMLATYSKLPVGSAGRAAAEAHAGDASGFLTALADEYFEVTTRAIRAADPNHLILGVRIVSVLSPAEVVTAAGRWVDVMSVNDYEFVPGLPATLQKAFGPVLSTDDRLADFYARCQKPLLFSELSWRARDSGLPNSFPPIYPVLATQTDRADAYERYARASFAAPYVVGHHWFEWADEPPNGRFDGENSNFGVVSLADDEWTTLVGRMTTVHRDAPHLNVAVGGE